MLDTDAEGDCQFDSAADQLKLLPGNEKLTKEDVRRTTIDWLRRNPDYRLSEDEHNVDTFATWIRDTQGMDWDDYLDGMAKPRVWGDEITLKGIVEGCLACCFLFSPRYPFVFTAYKVKILLWSSTVSEDNYFSVHEPKNEPSATLCMCHFLEVHYGSLLNDLEFTKRVTAKRLEFVRVLKDCSFERKFSALCDVFLLDNARFSEELDRTIIRATLESNHGDVDDSLTDLSKLMTKNKRKEVVISLHRVQLYGGSMESGSSTSGSAEEELAKAFSIIKALKDENESLKAKVANLESSPKEVAAKRTPDDASLKWSVLLDEDGKKWLKVSWSFSSFVPIQGDMLSLERVPVYGVQKKLLQRLPCVGGKEGASLFEFPKGILYCRFVYSRKGEEIVTSEQFCAGPKVELSVDSVSDNSVTVNWAGLEGYLATSSDWIGVFGKAEDRSYLCYDHVKVGQSSLSLPLSDKTKTTFVAKYFCAENKHVPICELPFHRN